MYKNVSKKQAFLDYFAEQLARESEAKEIYSCLHSYFKGKVDAIYEDIIISLVGSNGLALLREFHLIESCGILEGRKLYAL